MQNSATAETSILGLIGHLRDEFKHLIKEEIGLAKTEIAEKISRFGKNATKLAIGGIAAFAGLIILLASLSSLLSFVLESAGVHRSLAFFIGALVIGGGAALAGYAFVAKAVKTFSQESIAPEKTLHSLKKLKVTAAEEKPQTIAPTPPPKRSSDQIQVSIDATRQEVSETAEEITERLKPRYLRQTLKKKIQEHPVRSSLIGAGTGLASFLVIRRRFRHANHK